MHPGNSEAVGPWTFIVPPQKVTSGRAEPIMIVPGVPAAAAATAAATAITTATAPATTTSAATTQSRMENFRKVKTLEEESSVPFLDLPSNVVEMKVKEGSKIRNLMGFAMGRMELADTRQIVFRGYGRAVTKTITCVEIMKRKLGGLHQVTKVQYKTLLEVWENSDPQVEGQAEHLTVHKNVPSICILLSKDPLDPNQMGYQPPDSPKGFWPDESSSQQDGSGASPKGVKRRLVVPHREDRVNKKAPVQTLQENLGVVMGCGP
uniref:Ribonuclease P protein subunit p25 n=1 Tax=Pogona vitticeps TaxID=103695 RepID=A0ABM5EXH6_9SAUR